MNCKPGDLAFIVGDHPTHPESLDGAIVEVLYASPIGSFYLPDGQLSRGSANSWVIKFQNPRTVRLTRSTRTALYAGCPDSHLRPIRGGTVTDEEVAELWLPPIPSKTPETQA
jgi:hypothetical protein